MKTQNRALAGRAALVTTALLWGTSFVILKTTLESVGTLWILAIRFTLATQLLGLFAAKRLKGLSPRVLRGGSLMGLSLAAAYIVQTYGLFYTTPGKNAFLTAVYCVLVPFLAWGIYRRKPKSSSTAARTETPFACPPCSLPWRRSCAGRARSCSSLFPLTFRRAPGSASPIWALCVRGSASSSKPGG